MEARRNKQSKERTEKKQRWFENNFFLNENKLGKKEALTKILTELCHLVFLFAIYAPKVVVDLVVLVVMLLLMLLARIREEKAW